MKSEIQMVIEYEIVESTYQQYKEVIHQIHSKLHSFEADQIQLNESNHKVIETFLLPTESHYYALKKLRKSKSHTLFGCLDPYIKGGLQQIGFYGIKKKR
ncbi:hypothetical protein [Neobacillus sp. D3-1R]|uniref:hypothetical protein n=1 Tax=Neobacillus sp. D3-1R TaxID=3445778 RepID=UPI003F9FB3C9